jgi:hypothetical protein
MRSFILFFLTGCISAAQSITIGAIGGARATDIVPNLAIDESKRYEVGPMIGVGLPFGLAIEVDALYSRDGFSAANSSALSSISLGARTNTWQVPLLLKYRLPFPIVKPFIEAGYAARVMTGSLHVDSFFLANPNGQFQFAASSENFDSVSHGFVAGGGVQIGVAKLQLTPQVRYTRWNNAPTGFSFPDGPSFALNQNQVDLLVGIGWKVH